VFIVISNTSGCLALCFYCCLWRRIIVCEVTEDPNRWILLFFNAIIRYKGIFFIRDQKAPARRSCEFSLHFLKIITTESSVYLPTTTVKHPRNVAYDSTLVKRRAESLGWFFSVKHAETFYFNNWIYNTALTGK